MATFLRRLARPNVYTPTWRRAMQTLASDGEQAPVFRAKRRFGLGTVLMCTIPFITFGLGTWQVQRLRWKVNLIQEMEERMEKGAIPLPRRINQDVLPDYEYRKVAVKGHYRHDQEMLLGPRTRGDGQAGYFIITPLVRENGTTILVKRGWVSMDKKDKRSRPESLTNDLVEVEGLLRMNEKRNTFTPDNDVLNNQWYWTDVDTMAKITGCEPLLVEQVSRQSPNKEHTLIDRGIPVGRSPVVEVRNSHMQYIITWYSLSAFTTVMLWRLLKKPINRPMKVKRL